MAEISDDELERRMRAKLFSASDSKPGNFSDEDQLMAERLAGIDNARRLNNAKGGRPVRLLPPPVISYEWYDIPGDWQNMRKWRINRVENGTRRALHGEHYDYDLLYEEIDKLKAKGFTVVENNLDRGNVAAPRRSQPKVSSRKAVLAELRFFRR